MSQLVGVWEMTMVSAARAAREGDLPLACQKLGHASWLAASTSIAVPKETADKLKREVMAAVESGNEAA